MLLTLNVFSLSIIIELTALLNENDGLLIVKLFFATAKISLLFLTVDSDYDLMQDEFYGDLYVVRYDKTAEGGINDRVEV